MIDRKNALTVWAMKILWNSSLIVPKGYTPKSKWRTSGLYHTKWKNKAKNSIDTYKISIVKVLNQVLGIVISSPQHHVHHEAVTGGRLLQESHHFLRFALPRDHLDLMYSFVEYICYWCLRHLLFCFRTGNLGGSRVSGGEWRSSRWWCEVEGSRVWPLRFWGASARRYLSAVSTSLLIRACLCSHMVYPMMIGFVPKLVWLHDDMVLLCLIHVAC